MMSYIIQRMPCMGCYHIFIVLAFSCEQAKGENDSKTDKCGRGQNETLVKDALEKQRKSMSQITALNTPPKPRRKQLIFDNMLLDYCRFWHYSDPFLQPLCNVLRPLDSHLSGKKNKNDENKTTKRPVSRKDSRQIVHEEFVRSSGSSAQRYGRLSWFHMHPEGGRRVKLDSHRRWPPATQIAR